MFESTTTDAFETLSGPRPHGGVLLTCEHATARVPAGWRLPDEDLWIEQTHWAWDPGAAPLVRALVDRIGGGAVLARFTRLLVDPNREVAAQDLFRPAAEGRELGLNRELSAGERKRRIDELYWPFHRAVTRAAGALRPRLLLAIHSFTPEWEGSRRAVDLGVLHVDQPDLAHRVASALSASSFEVRVNEPYTGIGGLIHSVHSHSLAAGCPGIEIEVNQRLVGGQLDELVVLVSDAIRELDCLG